MSDFWKALQILAYNLLWFLLVLALVAILEAVFNTTAAGMLNAVWEFTKDVFSSIFGALGQLGRETDDAISGIEG